MLARAKPFALALTLVAAACLDTVEPTPRSSIVTIESAWASTMRNENESAVSFNIPIQIRNLTTRQLFLDANNRTLEKLVDQKWVVAIAPQGNFTLSRTINPSQQITFNYSYVYFRNSASPPPPILENVRGVYRIRFNLSYTNTGTDLLPAADSYSQPFVVE